MRNKQVLAEFFIKDAFFSAASHIHSTGSLELISFFLYYYTFRTFPKLYYKIVLWWAMTLLFFIYVFRYLKYVTRTVRWRSFPLNNLDKTKCCTNHTIGFSTFRECEDTIFPVILLTPTVTNIFYLLAKLTDYFHIFIIIRIPWHKNSLNIFHISLFTCIFQIPFPKAIHQTICFN